MHSHVAGDVKQPTNTKQLCPSVAKCEGPEGNCWDNDEPQQADVNTQISPLWNGVKWLVECYSADLHTTLFFTHWESARPLCCLLLLFGGLWIEVVPWCLAAALYLEGWTGNTGPCPSLKSLTCWPQAPQPGTSPQQAC